MTSPGPLTTVYQQTNEQERQQRLLRIKRAWESYYGNFPDTLRPVRNRDNSRTNDNVKVNKARTIANTSVHFLFGRDVGFDLEGMEAAGQYLSGVKNADGTITQHGVWTANKKAITLMKLGLNGAVTGHTFVKIVPGPTPLTGELPRLVILDPATVDVTWDPDDLDLVEAYEISYVGNDPRTGKPMLYRQLHQRDGERWNILDQQKGPDDRAWQTIKEEVWPWPFSAVVDCQNLPAPNQYYGISDLEPDVLDLNKQRNFLLSNALRIIRFHAHPRTWGKGFNAKELETSIDATIVLPGKDASIANLEMQSDGAFVDLIDRRIDEAIHELSDLPPVAVGKVENVGQLSSLALKVLYAPLIARTETKRLLYGELLIEINRRLLAMAAFGDDLRTTLQWQDVLPTDPMQEVQTALLEEQLGVSRSTLIAKLGYDADQEATKKGDEDAAAASVAQRALDAFDQGDGLGADGRANGKAAAQ